MATKLQNQGNRSVRVPSAVSLTGKRFLTNLRHNHASSFTGKTVTKQPRACPRVTMKNLCLRRVFSPSSISSDWDFHMKGENQTKEQNVESFCNSPNSNVTREGNKELCGGLLATGEDLEEVEFSQTTSQDSEMFTSEPSLVKGGIKLGSKVIRHPEKIFKNPGSVSYRRLLPYLMETGDGTRDVDGKDLKNEGGESMAAKDRILETRPVLHGNSSPLKKMTSSSVTKVSLCSRKLFKVPGSVNYRRMLSYLKQNSDDSPGTPETSKHIDPQKHIEENDPATENKGSSIEAKVSNTCSNNVEAPLLSGEQTGNSNFC
ncbi:hypothetical protein V5N11_026264 [Cardamine amara subsp. amara]|uniref:Uncharacterized protein n=1 Tax=Cardamine amara subsp. amara TaxID=228776 RepID=A0ABD0ZU99_CARAN